MKKTQIIFIIIGVMLMLGLAGCGKGKYHLTFDRDAFSSKKTEYAAGEKVKVVYDYRAIGTDTDYRFYSDDVEFQQDFEPMKGYVFTFTMPDHDVAFTHTATNSMTALPGSYEPWPASGSGSVDPAKLPEGFWLCPECGAVNEGAYCSECGHKQPEE